MEKVSGFKAIKYVKGWDGKEETLFFHEVIMDNGDEAKLDANTEESPSWLFVGNKVRYSLRSGPRGMLLKFLGLAGAPPQTHSPSSSQQPHRKNNQEVQEQKRPQYPPRLDSDPAFKLRQQKCISLTTCLDRANELVIAGKIELEKKHEYALNDFHLIMKHSGIDDMEKMSSENTSGQTGNPDTQTTVAPELFQDEPVSDFLKEAISRCDTAKQLTTLRGQLRENESTNKNVLTAIHNREAELKKKK